ncbi:MAG: hypothetical protein QM523_10630 [Candidatus Pacebacteria bacterium]|nr:hypothetical protein [Candidatus Paceibacterota bacterium]
MRRWEFYYSFVPAAPSLIVIPRKVDPLGVNRRRGIQSRSMEIRFCYSGFPDSPQNFHAAAFIYSAVVAAGNDNEGLQAEPKPMAFVQQNIPARSYELFTLSRFFALFVRKRARINNSWEKSNAQLSIL